MYRHSLRSSVAKERAKMGNRPRVGFGGRQLVKELGPWLSIEIPDMVKKGRIKKIE